MGLIKKSYRKIRNIKKDKISHNLFSLNKKKKKKKKKFYNK